MFEEKISEKKLLNFINNLRFEDLEELKASYKTNNYKKFIDICLDKNNEVYYIKTNNSEPLCLGGCYKIKTEKKEIGQIWLLSSKYINENKYDSFKYIHKKLNYFKSKYNILFNFIYFSNYKLIPWLQKNGFKILDTSNKKYKFFYYTKGEENFDLRHFASKYIFRQ